MFKKMVSVLGRLSNYKYKIFEEGLSEMIFNTKYNLLNCSFQYIHTYNFLGKFIASHVLFLEYKLMNIFHHRRQCLICLSLLLLKSK